MQTHTRVYMRMHACACVHVHVHVRAFFMPIMSTPRGEPSTWLTASTTILAKNSLCPETSFDESEVAADLSSMSFRAAGSITSRCTAIESGDT